MHQISAVSTVNCLICPVQISRPCLHLTATHVPLDVFSSFVQKTSPPASQSLQTRLTVQERSDENRRGAQIGNRGLPYPRFSTSFIGTSGSAR